MQEDSVSRAGGAHRGSQPRGRRGSLGTSTIFPAPDVPAESSVHVSKTQRSIPQADRKESRIHGHHMHMLRLVAEVVSMMSVHSSAWIA